MSEDAPAIKARLVEFLKFKKIKMAQLEKKAGLANAYLRNSNGAIGATKLRDILQVCPDLDANWLLTGVGEMLKKDAGEIQHINGDNAKGVFKGNMTINENQDMTALTNIDIENIDELDLSELPTSLIAFMYKVKELKRERDYFSNELNELKSKLESAEQKLEEKNQKVEKLSEELLQLLKERMSLVV